MYEVGRKLGQGDGSLKRAEKTWRHKLNALEAKTAYQNNRQLSPSFYDSFFQTQ